MAKFGEKIFDFKEVLKTCMIPVACVGDQWFLNVGKNSVVNVRDQKTLHTWTLMHPHYFTSSVVHSFGYLYCIIDKNILIKWSVEEDNLKNAEKIEFQDSVFTIIPINGTDPLIIFDSGKYAIITSTFYDIKPSDFSFINENEEVIWADACVSTTDVKVFCLVCNQKEKDKILYNFSVAKDSNSSSSLHSCKISYEKAVLKSWCLNHHNSSFLSLWSNGLICCHDVKESKITELLSLKDIDKNTIIDIGSIDSTHIALAKAHPKQEECILEIWDSKCAVLKAKKLLKVPCLNYIQIATINSNMFVCFNQELVAVAFHIEDPTFYAALGMSESKKYVQHSWNTELELVEVPGEEELEAMDTSSNHDSQDSIENVIEKLVNQNSPDLMCIPESELLKLLKVAIKHNNEETIDKKQREKNVYDLLSIIFSASFNDILLVQYLKRMNLEETLIVLRWLLSFLNNAAIVPSDVFRKPTDLQIVNWTCLIIQSHTEALLFSKDKISWKLLKQFERALSVKMEEYEDFDCIRSYFSIIEKKDIMPQKFSNENYCMENLEI